MDRERGKDRIIDDVELARRLLEGTGYEVRRVRETEDMKDYTDDEWDGLTEAEQEEIRRASAPKKGQNPNMGPGHNRF